MNYPSYSSKKMISMTSAEITVVVNGVARDKAHDYAPDVDPDHDQYGNDTSDHHSFDARHTEDLFPY